MPRLTRFTPKQTPKGWRINVPANYAASGKRERHFYPSRQAALEAAASLREKRDDHGTKAGSISPSLADDATRAADLLAPYDVSLTEAARHYVATREAQGVRMALTDALLAFREAKEGRSAVQVRNYRLMAEQLLKDFPKCHLSDLKGEDIEKHIRKRTGGPASFNQRLRLLAAFWKWCAKKPRRWCDPAELSHIEREETVSGHIGTLTAAQCRKLMVTAEDHHPDMVPSFAIAMFTGMRQIEIERLKPEDIRKDGIEVPALSSKTKRRRFIHMPEPLAAWLKAYPIGDDVLPKNWKRKQRAVRRLAGWKVWSDLVEPNEPPEELPEWPDNALRHTAATVALGIGKPIETLVFEHGHSGGLQVLRSHYVGLMAKAECQTIQRIRPKKKAHAIPAPHREGEEQSVSP